MSLRLDSLIKGDAHVLRRVATGRVQASVNGRYLEVWDPRVSGGTRPRAEVRHVLELQGILATRLHSRLRLIPLTALHAWNILALSEECVQDPRSEEVQT